MKYLVDDEKRMCLSKIGLGTGRFGTKIAKELSFDMLDTFYRAGGTVIDTARNYYEWVENGRGKSEETIGEWLEIRKNRDKICISTKCGVRNDGNKWYINLSLKNLLEEQKESLQALRTDRIDLYLLHRDEIDRPVEEIVDTMQVLKEKGKVSRIGVCNWRPERIWRAFEYARLNHLEPFSMIQTWWSLAEYTDAMWNDPNTTHMDESTYQYLKRNDFIGMAYTSQCKGFFQKAIRNGIDSIDDFLKARILTQANLRKLHFIEEICVQNHLTPTGVVNAYITDNDVKGIALVSCSQLEQLIDILAHSDEVLDKSIIERLDELN